MGMMMTKRTSSPDLDAPDESNEETAMPVKRYYRQRAHCNPWSDHSLDIPKNPAEVNWSDFFEAIKTNGQSGESVDPCVRFVDVGCGYGGLLYQLATHFPTVRSLGFEIRLKVCDFVQDKIRALRVNHPEKYGNIACVRTNAMKFLPYFFNKGQLRKMFFLYPDPHFKRVKHKWRIISPTLLDVYAYLLAPAARLYAVTDVPELAQSILDCTSGHALFETILCAQFTKDISEEKPLEVVVENTMKGVSADRIITTQDAFDKAAETDFVLSLFQHCSTDESLKATREGRGTTVLVFERLPNPSCC